MEINAMMTIDRLDRYYYLLLMSLAGRMLHRLARMLQEVNWELWEQR